MILQKIKRGILLPQRQRWFRYLRFKSSTNRAPKKTSGKLGEEFWIWLQLKVIADVGIIGKPNAGKSSLLAVLQELNRK